LASTAEAPCRADHTLRGSVREGNLLRVAPLALLEKELEAEIARQKQIAEVVPVETRLIGVSYAEARCLAESKQVFCVGFLLGPVGVHGGGAV
jgi:hypothetical protein